MIRAVAFITLAFAATAAAGFWSSGWQTSSYPGAAFAQSSEAEAPAIAEMSLGNADAAVTVIEYASFTCPHCRSFHETTFDRLKADYIDTGKIHFIYREVYFDRFGLWAGMLARCGDSERYFGFVDALYETQSEWTDGEPADIAENLRRLGRTAGLTDEDVNACLSDQAKAEAMVAAYQANVDADGINSTPSFIINGESYSNMGYDEFSAILDEALGD